MLTSALSPRRHEDARVGPGVGVAKGKSKAKPKGTTKPITATTAPSTSGFASTSRSMSTTSTAAVGAAGATKRKYAEPGAQKRAITVGRGLKPSDYEDKEFDDPFDDKENFVTATARGQAPPPAKKKKDRKGGIELLLAKKLDLADKAKKDPTGWWISEKCMSSAPFQLYEPYPQPLRLGWSGHQAVWNKMETDLDFALPPSQWTVFVPTGTANHSSGRASATRSLPRSTLLTVSARVHLSLALSRYWC